MQMSRSGRSDAELYSLAVNEIEENRRRRFDEIGCHGWEHVERVRSLSRAIGKSEGADLEVLDAAALFHDSMRSSDDHSLASTDYARRVLGEMGFSRVFCDSVSSAIASHSFSAGRAAGTLEGRALSDADRLDAMGALGIYRTVQYNMEHGYHAGRICEHIRGKLLKLHDLLYTEAARSLAKRRVAVLELYLSAMEEELAESSSSR